MPYRKMNTEKNEISCCAFPVAIRSKINPLRGFQHGGSASLAAGGKGSGVKCLYTAVQHRTIGTAGMPQMDCNCTCRDAVVLTGAVPFDRIGKQQSR